MQYACAILSSVPCRGLQYFSPLSHERHDFLKIIERKICIDFPYNVCLKYFSFHEELSEMLSKMYIGLNVKYPLFLPDFNEPWIFWTDFPKILRHQISWIPFHWEPKCSMWTDRPTGNSHFSKLCERASKLVEWFHVCLGVVKKCNVLSTDNQCYRNFCFKAWNGPASQVQTLNGIMEIHSVWL
jgi:hypothetical protein